MKKTLAFLAALFVGSLALSAQSRTVEVEVKGLSCPFCAYGLEKHFQELDGVRTVTIDIKKGLAILTLRDDATLTKDALAQTVRHAGFTPGEIRFLTPEKKENIPNLPPENSPRTKGRH
ncbi:MAG: copper chaperone [Bacteroidetes bacterium]|nr:MAG: copper chaperone [Bacteroidota bacterium]